MDAPHEVPLFGGAEVMKGLADPDNIERLVAEFTRAVAPILLSMIESLGNLDGEPVPTLAG